MTLNDANDLCVAILCKLSPADRRRAFEALEVLDTRPPGPYRQLLQLRHWPKPLPIEVGTILASGVRWREDGTTLWNVSTPKEFAEAVRRAARGSRR